MNELNDLIKKQILRIFNTQKKKEISEKYQASFISGDEEGLPPEIEAEWLTQIEEFERQYEKASAIPLLEYIGSPIIQRIDGLSNHDLMDEYTRMESILVDNGVYIDFPDGLDIKERYRFISEELIFEVIDDIRIPGMNLHFIYEEFHPSEDVN